MPTCTISEPHVTATPRPGERRCTVCGCTLGADHRRAYVCSPCLERRRYYDPAHDPSFIVALEELFLLHPNEVVKPLPMLGIAPRYKWGVRMHLRRLRQRMRIEGVPGGGPGGGGGYIYRPDKVGTRSGA